MAINKRYRRRPALKSKRPYKKRAYKAKRNTIKKVVNQILSRKVETKVVQYAASLTVRCLQPTTTQGQFNTGCLCVTPQGATSVPISQGYPVIGNGVGQDQRVGDECKIKGQYIDYICNAEEYNATTNTTAQPHIVTIWVVKQKNTEALGLGVLDVVASSAANFFENQTNLESGLNGNFLDHLRKVDTDNYQIIAKRVHKMGFSGQLNAGNVVSFAQNNDYKQLHKGRIKIPSYTWKVDRNEAHQGRNVFMFATYTNCTEFLPPTTQISSTLTFNLTTYYTDM